MYVYVYIYIYIYKWQFSFHETPGRDSANNIFVIPAPGTITPQNFLKVKEPGKPRERIGGSFMKTNGSLRVLKYPELVGGLILLFFLNTWNGIYGYLNLIFSKCPKEEGGSLKNQKNNTTLSSFLWSFLSWWIDDSGFLCLGLSEMKWYCTVKEAKYSTTAENMSLYMGYPSISIYEG